MIAEILAWLATIIIEVISKSGYFGVTFLMALESACLPVPSEVIMPFSGYLVAQGSFNFWWVVFWGSIGNLIGSIAAYWVGYFGGRPFIGKYGKYFLISLADLDKAEFWFKKYGQGAVFFSRLLPIVRTFISLPAGISKMEFKKFSFYTLIGSIPWAVLLTYIGFVMGENWQDIKIYFEKFDLVIGGLILIGVIWWIWRHFRFNKLSVK